MPTNRVFLAVSIAALTAMTTGCDRTPPKPEGLPHYKELLERISNAPNAAFTPAAKEKRKFVLGNCELAQVERGLEGETDPWCVTLGKANACQDHGACPEE